MTTLRVCVLFFIILLLPIQTYTQTEKPNKGDFEEFEVLLAKCAEYCERVKSIALFYVCREEIRETKNFFLVSGFGRISPFGGIRKTIVDKPKIKRTKNNVYIYDYQLIRKEGRLIEQRTLLEKNNRERQKKNAALEMRLHSEYLIYGAVGFLSQDWQKDFNYKILRREKLENVLTAVIKATPKPNNLDNRNFAQLWINVEDGSVMQIEWQPESIVDPNGNRINFEVWDYGINVKWKVTYGTEKNGVRFPSLQHIQEFLVSEEGREYLQNEIFFSYTDYKFFVVETEIIY